MKLEALDFQGKTVWVTGAYQGIGRTVADAFAKLGADVVGFDRKLSGEERDLGFFPVPIDLASEESVERAVSSVLRARETVDVLVHAAGILHLGSVESLSVEAWSELFAVNVTGAFRMLKRVAPLLKRQRRGAIVAIGSNAAHVPRHEMIGYCASKAALASLCRCVGLELAPYGVRCNTISPGSTDTPMQRALWRTEDDTSQVVRGALEQYRLGIPLGKLATTSDIANLAVFLASDLAGHLALQDIVVDGGATLGA